jgi:hypothetical protein
MPAPADKTNQEDSVRSIQHRESRIPPSSPTTPLSLIDVIRSSWCDRTTTFPAPVFRFSPMSDAEMASILQRALDLSPHDTADLEDFFSDEEGAH